MPIIKSAIKRMRQSEKRRNSNFTLRSRVKSEVKKVITLALAGKKEEAEKVSRTAYSVIDKALKKHVLHRNNAARKKSRIARVISAALKK